MISYKITYVSNIKVTCYFPHVLLTLQWKYTSHLDGEESTPFKWLESETKVVIKLFQMNIAVFGFSDRSLPELNCAKNMKIAKA